MEFLRGILAPITSEIGFLEAPHEEAAQAFADWHASLYVPKGFTIESKRIRGSVLDVLRQLEPLTSIERRRHLFAPTASRWTACFDNGWRGTDAMPPMSFLAKRIGCRGIRAVAIPNTMRGSGREARGRYGAVILEVYGPENTHFLNYVRTIAAVNDGGRWAFDQSGEPFAFEEMGAYSSRRIRDRFTPTMLAACLRELGLFPFEDSFFSPCETEGAILVERHGPSLSGVREYSLAEVQSYF